MKSRPPLAHWQTYCRRKLSLAIRKVCWLKPSPVPSRCRGASSLHVEITLIGHRRKMEETNRKYRGIGRPTDVLSFPAQPHFGKQGLLGDLLICLPVARSQAHHWGHALEVELQVLLVHGLLHLLGHDHEAGEAQARTMAKWEEKILAELLGKKAATQIGLLGRR